MTPPRSWPRKAPTTNEFPPPQRGPAEGVMFIPEGFTPVRKPGRCSACGMHVEAQGGHRTFCPRTGKPADL